MSDVTILLRDMAGDAAQAAANRVNPSQDQLAQLDHPAEDNTWHDVPSTGDLKGQAKGFFKKNAPVSQQDFKDAAGDATQQASPNNTRDPQAMADMGQQDPQGTAGRTDTVGGAISGAQTLRDRASDNIPDEKKDNLNATKEEYKGRAKGYLQDKIPQERRDQTIYRLKKMVVEIQGHQDCKFI